jgi:hypothetical protein
MVALEQTPHGSSQALIGTTTGSEWEGKRGPRGPQAHSELDGVLGDDGDGRRRVDRRQPEFETMAMHAVD